MLLELINKNEADKLNNTKEKIKNVCCKCNNEDELLLISKNYVKKNE